MARTMDGMKDAAASWAHEIKTHEMEKRRVLDEGFLRPPAMKLTAGQMKSQERVFDPLLQRYRDHNTEYKQRLLEETERINHLNRAMDVQVLREQPHHILHHESKFDTIAPGLDPVRQPHKARQPVGKGTVPDSQQDYNIISNIPFDDHHWNRSEQRPRCVERTGRQRKVHASRIRDFNIVNNRYPFNHEERTQRETHLNKCEAVQKYASQRRFDPVSQQFNDPKDEENAKHADDARDVEVQLRSEDKIPPSYRGRHTAYYDAISNEVYDPPMVKYMEEMEAERKDRYRNRYIVEHNFHAQDVKGDHLKEARKLNKVAPERFQEHERGYDFITNRTYGNSAKDQVHYSAGYPKQRKTPWEEIEESHKINGTGPSRSASTPALPSAPREPRKSTPADVTAAPARRSNSGAASNAGSGRSQGSQRSQRSQVFSEAGGRALSNSGSATRLLDPPGATRPIPRASSTPNLAPVPELSASAVTTMKLPPQVVTTIKMPPPSSGGGGGSIMSRPPPPAPAIPGSPMGSVYSRPSAKP